MDPACDQPSDDGGRDQFIPIRKTDILDSLLEHGSIASALEKQKFYQLCRLLGSIYHHQYFDQLERLPDDYYLYTLIPARRI